MYREKRGELGGPGLDGLVRALAEADGRVLARSDGQVVYLCDRDGGLLGVLLPGDAYEQLTVDAGGHYRGSARV